MPTGASPNHVPESRTDVSRSSFLLRTLPANTLPAPEFTRLGQQGCRSAKGRSYAPAKATNMPRLTPGPKPVATSGLNPIAKLPISTERYAGEVTNP